MATTSTSRVAATVLGFAAGAGMLAATAACEGSLAGLVDGAKADGHVADTADSDVSMDAQPDADASVVGDAGAFVCPTGAFCDDFEKGLSAADWTIEADSQRSNVGVDEVRPHAGKLAAHMAIQVSGATGGSIQHGIAARTTGMVVVRAWVFVRSTGPSASLIELRSAGRAFGGVSLKLYGTKVGYDITDTKGAYVADGTGGELTFGDWVCLRYVVELGSAGRIRVLSGETTLLESASTNTLADSSGWPAISIGLPFVQDGGGAEAFVDDVVIADQMVPCQ